MDYYKKAKTIYDDSMKNKYFEDHAPRNGSKSDEDSLGLLSGFFILFAMVIISIIIADVATGFNLHNLLANASSGA